MKPFNLADAKAGHPVCTADHAATIVKFDMHPINERPLLAVVHQATADVVRRYTERGWSPSSTLYMAPVGQLNGRDVYPGDIINGKSVPHDKPFNPDEWRPVVETQMGHSGLREIFEKDGSFKHVANAALKHAVDNGYLVVPDSVIRITGVDLTDEELARIAANRSGWVIHAADDSNRELRIAKHFYSAGSDARAECKPYPSDGMIAAELAKVE